MEKAKRSQSNETLEEKIAYEYLCHLNEAKLWIESVLKEKLPPVIELEENLRNGVYLARLGNVIAPDVVPLSRIYDIFQHRYRSCGLQFKHTDNINHWIKALNAVNFPKIFIPETMDLYERKNMPKVIYCIHALSKHLFKLGKSPFIQDLYGKVEFDKDHINSTCQELKSSGIEMPSFKQINGILVNETNCDHTTLNKVVISANHAIENKSREELLNCLSDPAVGLIHVFPQNINDYMSLLRTAKSEKSMAVKNRSLRDGCEPDSQEELLSQSEIQGYIESVNYNLLWRDIESCLKPKNREKLKQLIRKISSLDFKEFKEENVDCYIEVVLKLGLQKLRLSAKEYTPREIIETVIRNGNRLRMERNRVSESIMNVKTAVKNKNPTDLVKALKSPPLKLGAKILDESGDLYLKELEILLNASGDLTFNNVRSTVASLNKENFDPRQKTRESHKTPKPFLTSFPVTYLHCDLQPLAERVDNDTSEEIKEPENIYLKNIDKIIRIQAFWRGYRTRKSLESLKNPTQFSLLRRMAIAHRIENHDYSEHLELQALRGSVVQTIKRNQELASKLDEIDTKIGLLVRNKMVIQNLDVEGKRSQSAELNKSNPKGINALNKETKTLIDGYRQLFYMLQTDPGYLTKVITRLPQSSNHIIQSCVLSLFNYGSSTRDAYLLLRLFRTALVEEVKHKFQKPIDALKGNPLVLRLALGFCRQHDGFNPLRNILGLLIHGVLNEKTYIDTNPVDIYRRWVNKIETETGTASDPPGNVTREMALSHPEVAEQLKRNLKILKMWVKSFLKRISDCSNQFPYALRFIAKVLWTALRERFPETSEKDIIKIVGNLVFYQYINSAIVAPDAFYIISLLPEQTLKPEQRRNLASIAKILQFAASKKGFGEESQHLMCLNPFIIACHEDMKLFCKKCCTVEDLEDHFNVTKYTEASLIEKPKIYITLEEICECHKMLVEERLRIAADPCDPIQEVLDSLGDPPTVAALIGYSPEDAISSRAGKTQICLELDNKCQLPPEDPTEAEKLFIKTKELIARRMTDLKGESLKEAVEKLGDSDIASNLLQLELLGLVKSSDDYGSLTESLIDDLTQKQQYKQNLTKEMRLLSAALKRLEEKKKYHEDQLSYYETYLNKCLKSLAGSSNGKSKKIWSKKYSACDLMKKGVLISLEGVPSNNVKSVHFEISNTECDGIYFVKGKFMGVEVERLNLDVQELLQHQFEGQPIIDLFGRAKVNVNLLLHLINSKFYAPS